MVVELPAAVDTDLRDVLDRGLGGRRPDVVVTRSPDLLGYAARSPGYFVVALPWARTYALVAPAGDSIPSPTTSERDAMARDAVRGEARGAVEPFAAPGGAFCAIRPPSATPSAFVAYAAGDPVAQELAERIVAMAAGRTRAPWLSAVGATARVVAIPSDSLAEALAGRVAAAVVGFARGSQTGCGWPGVTPLVDTREHAIVRRGSGVAFAAAPDGSLWFIKRSAP